MESCTRPRSWESSASRRSSSPDILLNSSPSAANSSRPTVGTCAEKSPAASLRAAVRKPAISRCSVRETRIAQAIASSRKPSRITPAKVLLLESAASPLSAASREPSVRTRMLWPANERRGRELLDAVLGPVDRRRRSLGRRQLAIVRRGQRAGEHPAAIEDDRVQAGDLLRALDVRAGVGDRDLEAPELVAARRLEVPDGGGDRVARAGAQHDLAVADEQDALDAAALGDRLRPLLGAVAGRRSATPSRRPRPCRPGWPARPRRGRSGLRTAPWRRAAAERSPSRTSPSRSRR